MKIPFPLRFLFLFIFSFSLIQATRGQEPVSKFRAPVAMYLELGGSAGISLNLDYLTYENGAYKSSIRLGAGVAPTQRNGKTAFTPAVPVEILGFIGKKAKHVEFGGGYTHHFTSEPTQTKSFFTGRFGFRYQQPRGGFLFRISIVPLLYKDFERQQPGLTLSPGFGLSLGKSF